MRPEDKNENLWTTADEDNEFKNSCQEDTITFKSAMEFFRKSNEAAFRYQTISDYMHGQLRERIELQCKLEGLI